MSNIKVEDKDYDLWLLFTRTHYHIKKARTHELRKYDLSPEQAGTLYYIHARGKSAIPLEISRWMLREPQTVTSIIDRMVRKGLVKKTKDTQRKNVIRLSLTEKGERAYESSIAREAFHETLAALSGERRQVLREILEDMLGAAKKFSKDAIEQEEVI